MAFLTIKQAQEKWGVSRATIRKWMETGRVSYKRMSDLSSEKTIPEKSRQDTIIITQSERPPRKERVVTRTKKPAPVPSGPVAGLYENNPPRRRWPY